MNEKKTSIWNRPFLPRVSLFGFVRWLFSWRIMRRCFFCLAVVVTLIAVFYAEEDWRGKRAWENYKREWEAKGEKFDWKAFVPPPVPDNQNFAMTPFLAPMFDFEPPELDRSTGIYVNRSIWRDTNAVYRINKFPAEQQLAEFQPNPWIKAELSRLEWLVLDLQGKSNSNKSKPSMSRAEAATQVLQVLEKYRTTLNELQTAASQRPYFRSAIYHFNGSEDPRSTYKPHVPVMPRIGQLFCLRASAELALGQNDEALADTKTALIVAGLLEQEPSIYLRIVWQQMLRVSLCPIWEGLATHQWSDGQLAELEQQLAKVDIMAGYCAGMREERAIQIAEIDFWRKYRDNIPRVTPQNEVTTLDAAMSVFHKSALRPLDLVFYYMPDGWFDQNKLYLSRLYQELTLSPVDVTNHRIHSGKDPSKEAIEKELVQITLDHGEGVNFFRPFKFAAQYSFPWMEYFSKMFAFTQTGVDEARVACALERHRLAHSEFPQTLDALSPQFMQKIPCDLFTGQQLKYRRTEDGQFILYSVGWNEKDDGGTSATKADGTRYETPADAADWVWPQYPAK